jgi:hypothetical protein
VHADGCVFPDTVRSLPARLSGPTKLVWGTGTQTDFYDRVEQVTFALAAIEAHFGPAS